MISMAELEAALNHLTVERIMDVESYNNRLLIAYQNLVDEDANINDGKLMARAIMDWLNS
jgi:hypothetical protein